MRISADKNDSGHSPEGIRQYDVYLDGVVCSEVITADEQQGLIIRVMRDESGLVVVNGEVVIEALYGKVELRPNK